MERNISIRRLITITIALLLIVASLNPQNVEANLNNRFILRRYSRGDNEENEATTVKSSNDNNDNSREQQGAAVTQLPPRLYPDLPREQYPGSAFGPQYGINPNYGQHPPNHGPPTPFVPFGPQMPINRLNGGVGGILDPTNHRQIPMQRPMSPTERAQSQSFVSGLGRRLLAMVGVEIPPSLNDTASSTPSPQIAQPRSDQDPMIKALRNSTVLQQLNKGVQSIYGSLSKMYNSTVQQQIDLLQERFKKEAENTTNPWQQRMAQQVPQFFKNMAAKVEDAQENLNRILRQVSQVNNGTFDATISRNQQQQQTGTRAFFDNFNGDAVDDQGYHPGNFISQIGRSFGFGDNDPSVNPNERQDRDFASQFMDFWHNQVQPQIGMVRGQISRVWRELTSSGALMPGQMIRARNINPNLGSANPADNRSSSDFVDNILNSIDLNNSEYSLIEPKDDSQQPQQQRPPMNNVGSQVQTRLISMQRELNQLWSGLTNSLQGAIGNVRQALNPGPQFNQLDVMAANNINKQEIDPAQNEIGDRIKDINKLQRDTDIVYDVVQKQQQAQRNQGIGDRFRNFFNNIDLGSVEQLPNRFSDSVSRFGNAVGDLWNQIPRRWDNFMNNMRQPNQVPNDRLTSPVDTKPKNQTENANQ